MENYGKKLLDFILPYTCLGCGSIDCDENTLCNACFSKLHILTGPFCKTCSHPLHDWSNEHTCIYCPQDFELDSVRCCTVYNAFVQSLILRFKNGDNLAVGKLMAAWMTKSPNIQDFLQKDTNWILAPVPLHWTRLWQRGFNQSAEIGRHFSQGKNIQWLPDLLIAQKRQSKSKDKTAHERAQRQHHFSVNPKYNMKNSCIWIIDDVMTSGATLNECAKILKSAGASSIIASTIARTPHPSWKI